MTYQIDLKKSRFLKNGLIFNHLSVFWGKIKTHGSFNVTFYGAVLTFFMFRY